MRKHTMAVAFAACMGMGLLILDSETALEGARDAVTLTLTVLIPSLFPFLFLSIALTGAVQAFSLAAFRPVKYLFHLPAGTEALLLTGFLGGYPAGAQAVRQAYGAGTLSRENAEKMLGFCNNAGPSFLFGMAAAFFSEKWMVWILWLAHILGALAAARIYPCSPEAAKNTKDPSCLSAAAVLKRALAVMAVICGWVLLFRVVIAFADRWFLWVLPAPLRVLIIGLLELSNGICQLHTIADEKVRFLLCSIMLSLGGLCVGLQTGSVTEGLSKRFFYRGKIIQLLVSFCCCIAVMYRFYAILLPLFLPFLLPKKRSGNPAVAGV